MLKMNNMRVSFQPVQFLDPTQQWLHKLISCISVSGRKTGELGMTPSGEELTAETSVGVLKVHLESSLTEEGSACPLKLTVSMSCAVLFRGS